MKVLLAERRLSAALELTARVACSSVGASPATWVDGPAPAGARVLLAELQPGERQIPRELCDLLADAPTLHLMLCAQEPLVSPRVVLADGRVSLLAPPVDHAQLVEALQAVVGPPPPPPSSERGARYERLRRSHWLAWTRGVAAPAPRVEDRAGVLVMLGEAGEDFRLVTLSIDPRETPVDATKKRSKVLDVVGKGDDVPWAFLTGDELNIRALASQLGISYAYDAEQDQYAHPAVVVFITPDGRVSRYLYGLGYDPLDVKLGLYEAADGKIGGPVEQIYLSCFSYDATIGQYGPFAMGIRSGVKPIVS